MKTFKPDGKSCAVGPMIGVMWLQAIGLIAVDAPSMSAQTRQSAERPALTGSQNPSLPAKKIGSDDLLTVYVYDAPEFSRTIRVSPEGTILLPLMKSPLLVAGLMPHELETKVAAALREEQLLRDPNVVVSIAEYGTRPIVVAGAVKNSVSFQAIGQVTLMDALTRAGGVAPDAGAEVLVSDSQKAEPNLVHRIPLKPLLEGTDPSLNVILTAGDEIRIPVAARISVLGNVKNTGTFPIPDSSDATVLGALVLAGGFAGPKPVDAYIIRRNDGVPGTRQIRVPLKAIIDRKVPDVQLLPHDYLYVPNNRKSETFMMLEKIAGVAGSGAFIINVVK